MVLDTLIEFGHAALVERELLYGLERGTVRQGLLAGLLLPNLLLEDVVFF